MVGFCDKFIFDVIFLPFNEIMKVKLVQNYSANFMIELYSFFSAD